MPGIWLFSVVQQVIASVSYQEDERKDNGEEGFGVTNTMLLSQNALKKSSHLILKVKGTLLLTKGEKNVDKKDSASNIRKDLSTEKLNIDEKTMLL